ncbi:capsule assembly Wzi family protein [Pontibacter harenae]|uniref:capsule assembly Wzi family protein n=1 Tax=Pontibacter harenae TaxID=2894083 RepID=UPI001E630F9F|nr:capsule assembly Wzi family protein [Pontibacter harenae]MCC9166165.1 capsule assembly Wzi family protein [Pontibacter harenae]
MFKLYITLILSFISLLGYSQSSNFHYGYEVQGVASSSSERLPFWLRSNQYGSVPLPGTSLSIINRVSRDYDSTRTRLFDWGASFEGRANIGERTELLLIEGYGKLRVGPFELKAGRSKEIMGLVDTTLSSGAFSVSGNALGIPKVQISIPEFYPLPLWKGFFAVKGNFAHGWVGETYARFGKRQTPQAKTYLHQKSLYGRIGSPNWKVKFYGGINHQVFWGDSKIIYPPKEFKLSSKQEYWYAVAGKTFEWSKVGNHVGSVDLGITYDFRNLSILAYRQHYYDKDAFIHFANFPDGLNGLSLENKRISNKQVQWKKLVFEVLYTKNQAGSTWNNLDLLGYEDYYNNYIYTQGWSYQEMGLGTPLISTKNYVKEELLTDSAPYFINNRVVAVHMGVEGKVKEWNVTAKASFSENYGTYRADLTGNTYGSSSGANTAADAEGLKQISTYLELGKNLNNGYRFGFVSALDVGNLYTNSLGGMMKLSKNW